MAPIADAEWEPVPLELPLDDPARRTPAPPGDPHSDVEEAPEDAGRRVIVIDLS